ncbi:DnaJ domain-containing protein [Capnocytophaga sputigena]|uniref:DnaJ domain-containing protein n=1 Tax=Capnocytophaga sputigena TaxID=1019 RepID=UPI00288BB69E|nr:DnaJ domain-containing protein [Capnocytophaga sputigena]
MTVKDYYQVLGLTPEAPTEEIRTAYRKLAKANHPDKHKGDPIYVEKFKDIQEAYDVLSDSYKRKEYDDQLARQNSYNKKNSKKEQAANKKSSKSSNDNAQQQPQTEQSQQPEQPRPEEIKDLHTLVDMYFKKRDITLQARKEYDSFLATPRKKYINWVTFIALLLFIAGVVVAMMFLN